MPNAKDCFSKASSRTQVHRSVQGQPDVAHQSLSSPPRTLAGLSGSLGMAESCAGFWQPAKLSTFTSAAAKLGYRAYHAQPTRIEGRPSGGVVTLVPKQMRQCPLVAVAGNLQICMVESLAIVSSYSAPGELQDQAAAVLAWPILIGSLLATTIPHCGILSNLPMQPRPSIQAKRPDGKATENFIGVSCAALFLDLSNAFHHVIREVVVGATDGHNLDQAQEEKFRCFASLPRILVDLHVSESIVRLLRDIQFSTWCTLHDRWLLRTHRGTCPGSPLADITFHALMAPIASKIDQWILDQHEYQAFLEEIGVEAPANSMG
eukprot:s228_g3.t1